MDTLLKDMLSHLRLIQHARKGGMGAPNNTYLPQLRVDLVDALAERVHTRVLCPPVYATRPQEEKDTNAELQR